MTSKLQGERHERFVALSREWCELRERFYATYSREEKQKIRKRKEEIEKEQEELLSA